MKSFKLFISEQQEDSDVMEMLSDAIEMYIEIGDTKKELHYKKIYKDKYGEEYVQIKPFNPEPTLNITYKKSDFKRYPDFLEYSDKLFRLKFNKYKSLIRDLPKSKYYVNAEQLIEFHQKLGITIEFKRPIGTEEAYVGVGNTKKIIYKEEYKNKKISKEIVIHELGHILDNKLGIPSTTNELFLFNNKSSVYDLDPGEIFAESFKNYILYPKFLKAGWSDVYNYFNTKISSEWKQSFKELIKI